MLTLSDAGWTSIAAITAAFFSALSAVLVALLRGANTKQHAASSSKLDDLVERQTRLGLQQADLAEKFVEHVSEEAERTEEVRRLVEFVLQKLDDYDRWGDVEQFYDSDEGRV